MAEQTNYLKICQEQLYTLRESIPEAPNEQSINESQVCRVCKKEISGGGDESAADINLHFADTSGLGIIGHGGTE